jgi:hypothetical protein
MCSTGIGNIPDECLETYVEADARYAVSADACAAIDRRKSEAMSRDPGGGPLTSTRQV